MVKVTDTEPIAIEDEGMHTPTSAAVDEATQQLSPKPSTPQSDQDEHNSDNIIISNANTKQDESDTADNDRRTPPKVLSDEGLGITTAAGSEGEEDSFVEQIKTRTPAKRSSRIEDSVEALDALEEEIEKVGGLIPEPTNVKSPTKPELQIKSPIKAEDSKRATTQKLKKQSASTVKPDSKKPKTSVRPAVPRTSMQPPAAKKVNGPSAIATNQKREAATKNPVNSPVVAPKPSQAALKKRVSSIHKAPFQPVKSTKPPTRSTFELPGDSVARKLKEQREERMKREVEEESKKRVFKARPVRHSQAPEVKLTAAAKARLSMVKGEPVMPATTQTEAPKPRLSALPGSMALTGTNKRQSSLTVAKRSTNPPPANSSARVTRAPSLNVPNTTRNPSATGAPRPAPTAEDLAHQKVKGKEVFGRTKVEMQERESAKKEKEEAAKKARADAAERGRIASRAWAEQQKLRKLEAEKAKSKPKAVEV